MIKPETSSKVNPKPYNIQDFFQVNKSVPDILKLLDLVKIFLSIAPQENQSFKSDLINYLLPLKNPQAPKAINSWAKKQLSTLLCKNCKKSPSDTIKSQLPLCKLCFDQQMSKSKCLYCLITHKDPSSLIPCKHICIFCCNMFLKKGQKSCKVCSASFKSVRGQLDSLQLTCSNCSFHKPLSKEPFSKLQCSHILCSLCIKTCLSDKVCPIDNVQVNFKNINIAIEYISDTCDLCKTKKKRKKIFFKKCCPYTICLKCTKTISRCPNCLTALSPQIKSQY